VIAALVLFPIVAGFAVYLIPKANEAAARYAGVLVAFATFALAAWSSRLPDETAPWFAAPFAASFHVGLGGIGYWLVLLLALATGCSLAVATVPRLREFVALALLLLGAMNGVFVARDLLLFALFWDLMLIPVFFVLVGWTAGRAGGVAWRYLVYNVTGGLALLLATAGYGIATGTTNVLAGAGPLPVLPPAAAGWILAGFAFAFLIKTPVWPLHTWMPETYAALPAPMAATVSAVQSKAGLYGFIVVGLALFPSAMHAAAPLMFVLGLVSLVYGAVVALVQDDVKRVVAYSSLSHLGLILIAIFSFNPVALAGALVYTIAHGLFSSGLFISIGTVESREETRLLSRLGGLGRRNPKLAGGLTIVALAALGLPGLCGFAGEILIVTGLYQAGFVWPAIVALVPIVIAAAYMLRVIQGVANGPEREDLPQRADLMPVEIAALAPLVAAMVLLGVAPGAVANSIAFAPSARDASGAAVPGNNGLPVGRPAVPNEIQFGLPGSSR